MAHGYAKLSPGLKRCLSRAGAPTRQLGSTSIMWTGRDHRPARDAAIARLAPAADALEQEVRAVLDRGLIHSTEGADHLRSALHQLAEIRQAALSLKEMYP